MDVKKKYLVSLLAFGLVGCGGGGGSVVSNNADTTVQTVVGTAAVGAAIANGVLQLKCQNTSSLIQVNTDSAGEFLATLGTAKLPCVMRATSADGQTVLHGFATGTASTVIANVTPLTDLIVATATQQTPASFFENTKTTDLGNVDSVALNAAGVTVAKGLAGLVDIGSFNPMTQQFKVGDAFDQKLDLLSAELKTRKISLNDLHNVVITKSTDGKTQAENVSVYIAEAALQQDLVKTRLMHEKLWQGFYEWVTVSYAASSPTELPTTTHEYKKILQIGAQAAVRQYEKNDARFTLKDSSYTSYNPSEFYQTTSGWKAPRLGVFFNHADISLNAKGTVLMLKSEDDTAVGRIQLKDLREENISNQPFSNKFNAVYTNNKTGVFREGSVAYTGWFELLDSFFIGGASLQDAGMYNDLAAFRTAYANRPFCSGIARQNGEYGIQFDLAEGRAHLYATDYSCRPVVGMASIEVSWEVTNVDGQVAMKIIAPRLPMQYTPFGSLLDGYDSTQVNSDLRNGTSKYEAYVWLSQDRKVQRGYKILPGATMTFAPGAGPYLNKIAIDSLFNALSYPNTVD